MKIFFKEFYPLTKNEFKSLWKRCIFVFDASFLLDLYEYSEKAAKEVLNLLKKLKKEGRIWIPYQFAFEYQKERLSTIKKLQNSCDKALGVIDSLSQQKCLELSGKIQLVKDEIEKRKKFYIGLFNKDKFRDNLTDIFNNKVGKKITDDNKIKKALENGEKRKIDIKEHYGDLVGWCEITEYAKSNKKPIIFITSEKKDAWWWILYDKTTIGPRYELRKDIIDEANVLFHIYRTKNFLDNAEKYLKQKISKDVVSEVEEINKKRLEEEIEVSPASSPISGMQESTGNLNPSQIQTIENEDVGESDSSQNKK